jgi:hypothetical protein
MSSLFPTALQDLDATRGTAGQPLSAPNHITHHSLEDATIEAIEAKLGINNSADASSIDYLLKSILSINPGHKHTAASLAIALSSLIDVLITSPADGNGLIFDGASGKWKNSTTSVADSSATVKGVTKLSVAPASASAPIAIGDNDPRLLTLDDIDALAGHSGTPISASNKLVDVADTATTSTNNKVVRANSSGKIDPSFISNIYASGATTKNMSDASAVQLIPHGLGTTPIGYKVIAQYLSNAPRYGLSQAVGNNTLSNLSTTEAPDNNTSFLLVHSSGNYQSGVLSADATNIIITWTKTGSPGNVANIIWDALA